MTIKTKAFPLTVKKLDDIGEFEGYGSVFGVKDSQNEIVDPPAFNESLVKHKREGTFPLMLWQHNSDEPIGVWEDLSADGKGLFAKGRLLVNQNVPEADKAHSLLKAGAVRGLSIGFRIMQGGVQEDDKAPGIFHLTKLDLQEVSIVSFPSNRRAVVDAVKSDDDERAIQYLKRFQEWTRRVRDGDIPLPKEFEALLRDAGLPRKQCEHIASRVHTVLRGDPAGEEATAAVKTALDDFRQALDGFTPPKL